MRAVAVVASALALVVVSLGACANGTEGVDISDEAAAGDGSTKLDGSFIPGDSQAGDSNVPVDAGKDTSPPVTPGAHVVLNEINPGSDADEFVELYNPTGASVSLAGYEIRYASAGGSAGPAGHKFTNETIGAKSFLVLKGSTWTPGLGAAAGQLGLFDGAGTGAKKVDGVAWGTVSGGTLHYGEGTSAQSPPALGSVGRAIDGVDTDNNNSDFTTFSTPTPGAPN